MHIFQQEKFTPEHRAQVAHIVDGLGTQIAAGIASGRSIDIELARVRNGGMFFQSRTVTGLEVNE